MPTNLPRVQCLLQPETFAKVETLRKHNRRSASHMCSELIETALKLPKYRDQIEEAVIQVPVRDDPRESVPQPSLRKAEREEPKYIDQIPEKERDVVTGTGLDSLTPERLAELQELLALVAKLKS